MGVAYHSERTTVLGIVFYKNTVAEPIVLIVSIESLISGHNWFLHQFVKIPQKSINVCFFIPYGKSRFKLYTELRDRDDIPLLLECKK